MTGSKRPGEVLKRKLVYFLATKESLGVDLTEVQLEHNDEDPLSLYGIVWGEPRPWTRPGRKGNRYFPRSDEFWSQAIRAEATRIRPPSPLKGPLFCMLRFFLIKPPSRKEELPDVKPDIDNLEKLFFDLCEKILYVNDSQVTSVDKQKRYIPPGGFPYLEFLFRRDYPDKDLETFRIKS